MKVLNELVSNRDILIAGIWSRDERGRAIIGKASIIAIMVFIVLINFFAKISDCIPINYDTVAFCVQWIYDIVVTVEVVAILIYKKIQ